MKAISIRQPWAWAILHAGKRVENRATTFPFHFGPILLHASKSVGTLNDFTDAVDDIAGLMLDAGRSDADVGTLIKSSLADMHRGDMWRPHGELPRGGIVGRARVVANLQDEDLMYLEDERDFGLQLTDDGHRVWYTGVFALVLADVEPLPFVPWKGALGLFEVPDDYATRAP